MTDPAKDDYGWQPEMQITLLEKIKQDLKSAMRNKDNAVRDAIRQVMSEFPNLTVPIKLESGKKTTRLKKPEEITNDDVIDIIRKLVKSEKTVLEAKKEASSPYLETLERYLPQMASREAITDWIKNNIDLSEFKSPMQAMGPIMKHYGKQADGRTDSSAGRFRDAFSLQHLLSELALGRLQCRAAQLESRPSRCGLSQWFAWLNGFGMGHLEG